MAAEPIAVMVRRHECPFCGLRRSARKAAREHIGRCWLNPETRSCKTCALLTDEPGGGWCIPGQPCGCNDGYRQCGAGHPVGYGEYETFPRTRCPDWKEKEDKPDGR